MIEDISIEIFYLNSSNVSDYAVKAVAEMMTMELGVDIDPLVYKKHVLGRWLMTIFLKNKGMMDITKDSISYSEFGKPYISGMPSFNISHSNEVVVCAIASHGEVGVDIENLRALPWQDYKECFSESEWRKISFARDPCSTLLEFWTMKESILKGDGRGLQVQMADVVLHEQFGLIGNDKKKWYVKPVDMNGYFCHVSGEYPIRQVTLKEVKVM